ncbi:MAG: hypothetical protein V3T58_08210 [Candidatus Hydrothermarchaeales archaeon]
MDKKEFLEFLKKADKVSDKEFEEYVKRSDQEFEEFLKKNKLTAREYLSKVLKADERERKKRDLKDYIITVKIHPQGKIVLGKSFLRAHGLEEGDEIIIFIQDVIEKSKIIKLIGHLYNRELKKIESYKKERKKRDLKDFVIKAKIYRPGRITLGKSFLRAHGLEEGDEITMFIQDVMEYTGVIKGLDYLLSRELGEEPLL